MRQIFRIESRYTAICQRSWTIAPAESQVVPAAIYLDGELEKVRGVQENTRLEAELLRVAGGMREHAATKAYQFKGVVLRNGRLLKGAMSHRVSALSQPDAADGGGYMESAVLASTLMGSLYFGHWMRDDASLNLAVQSIAPLVNIARQEYFHEQGYRELLALHEQRIAHGNFGELVLLDDWGQNADKRCRYQKLRASFKSAIPISGNQRVYIKRADASDLRGRALLNADLLEQFLVQQGFAVVDPDTMSAQEIARISNGARLVVGLEGSHLAHSIYPIADAGTLLVLQPPLRFNNVYKDLSDAMGLNYAFLVGEPAAGGFTVDLDRLGRLLDRVGA